MGKSWRERLIQWQGVVNSIHNGSHQAGTTQPHSLLIFVQSHPVLFISGGWIFCWTKFPNLSNIVPQSLFNERPKTSFATEINDKNAPSLFATKILYVFYKCWCELSLGLLFTLYVVAQSSYFCKIIKIFSRMEVLLEMQWTAFGWKLFSREIWKITKYIILIYTWSICIVLPNIVKICKTFLMWLWCVMIVTCQVTPCPHITILTFVDFFLSQKSEMAAKIWSFCVWQLSRSWLPSGCSIGKVHSAETEY